jgi:hypothetical protein
MLTPRDLTSPLYWYLGTANFVIINLKTDSHQLWNLNRPIRTEIEIRMNAFSRNEKQSPIDS